MLPDYAELHCLSNFSFLRGASHPDELVEQAVAQGYAALALTDECSLAGIVRAHQAARQAGIKLLVGSEMTTLDGLKLVFIAQNREGYGNLSALITLARRRAEKGHYTLHRHDLNAVSPNGALPDCLVLWVPGEGQGADEGRWLAERFPGRLWIAVELHAGADDTARLAGLQELASACQLPLVAAGDVHMHVKARRPVQDVLTAVRLKTTVFEAGYALFPNGERHLRSRLRLSRLYPPALLAESLAVAQRCSFSLDELRGTQYNIIFTAFGALGVAMLFAYSIVIFGALYKITVSKEGRHASYFRPIARRAAPVSAPGCRESVRRFSLSGCRLRRGASGHKRVSNP